MQSLELHHCIHPKMLYFPQLSLYDDESSSYYPCRGTLDPSARSGLFSPSHATLYSDNMPLCVLTNNFVERMDGENSTGAPSEVGRWLVGNLSHSSATFVIAVDGHTDCQ